MDAEFLAVLLAVQADHQTLLTELEGSPKQLLSKLLGKKTTEKDVKTVCAGLKDLELITQFTGLCLGKSSGILLCLKTRKLGLHLQIGLTAAD